MRFLAEICTRRAFATPHKVAYRFFHGQDLESEQLTCYQIWELAASLAFTLQSRGLIGERVLLICKKEKNFIVGFFACLFAGSIAVPTALPRRQHLQRRLDSLAADSNPTAIISDSEEILSGCGNLISNLENILDIRSHIISKNNLCNAKKWVFPTFSSSTVAFLQYTSGSTGTPKWVAITHNNLDHNCLAIERAMEISVSSVVLTALPIFYDMGLVGGVLVSMYTGCEGNFLAPNEFVQFPERWLKLISLLGVTHSGGPNFMYDLACRMVTDIDLGNCDLSSWKVAFCGAERRWCT